MEDLIEAYNTALKNQENQTIEIVNKSLDRAFNRLLRRTYAQLRSGQFQTAERNARTLELIPPLPPVISVDNFWARSSCTAVSVCIKFSSLCICPSRSSDSSSETSERIPRATWTNICNYVCRSVSAGNC